MAKFINISFLLISIFASMPAYAQSPAFYHLSTSEGLSDNTVNAVARDKNGILWVGTTEGLNSYDGNKITTYQKHRYPLLAGNSIENIIADPENKIWINSNAPNINMLDEERRLRLFTVGDPADKSRITRIFYTKSKGIIAIKGKQQFYLNSKTASSLEKLKIPDETSIPKVLNLVNNVNGDTVFFYGNNNLVLYDYANMSVVMSLPLQQIEGITPINKDELIAYTNDRNIFYRISISQKKVIKEYKGLTDQFKKPITGSLRGSVTIKENVIALTSRYGGIYLIDFNASTVMHYEHDPLDSRSLGGNNTYRIKYDTASGYLFVTTLTSGLHYFNTRISQAAYKPYFINEDKAVFDGFIQSVTQAGDGSILMGAQDRLIYWDRKNNITKYVPCYLNNGVNIQGRETIRAVKFDDNGNLWVGTSTKGVLILNKAFKTIAELADSIHGKAKFLPSRWINAFIADTRGNMWVGTLSGTYMVEKNGFTVHEFSKHPVLSKISKIACASLWLDKRGRLWIGTVNGVWCYDESANTIKAYNTTNGLIHNTVLGMNEDDLGNYYFGTAEGLSVLSATGTIKNYNRSNGLKNDRCDGILKDEKGFIWIANLSCIIRYDPNTATFAVHEDGSGLRMRSSHQSTTGEMFWGTDKGLTYFYPHQMNSTSQPLSPSINAFTSTDTAFGFTKQRSISVPYHTSSLVFNFSSGEISGSKKIQMMYRLAGYDNEWKTPVTPGQAAYSKLQPGKYYFEVKASRDGNVWYSAHYNIELVVNKPWWQQNWFRLLCIAFGAAVLFAVYKYYQKKRIEKEAEKVIDYFAGSAYEKSSVEDILWDICRNCIYMLRFEDCVIYLLDKEKNVLVQKAAYGPKNPKAFEIKNPLTIPLGKGIVGHVAATGKAEIINDTSKDNRYIMDDEKRLSEITVPIIHEGKVIGVIDSENRKKNFFTPQHLKTLQKIATLSSARISHALITDAMKKNRLELMELNVKMAESRFSNLRLQMNPHFLFNSLSSIQHLIVSQQTTRAYKYLTVFSNFLRTLLNFAEKNFIPLDEELKILKMYLELESLRFDQSFSYEIMVDDNLTNDEILLPSLMIQPFAENAIWHGLLHKEGDKKLSIRINNISEEYLTCTIEDNGIGRAKSAEIQENKIKSTIHESKGIGIIEERLSLMQKKTGKPAKVEIFDLYDNVNQATGTKVIITIPYYNPEES